MILSSSVPSFSHPALRFLLNPGQLLLFFLLALHFKGCCHLFHQFLLCKLQAKDRTKLSISTDRTEQPKTNNILYFEYSFVYRRLERQENKHSQVSVLVLLCNQFLSFTDDVKDKKTNIYKFPYFFVIYTGPLLGYLFQSVLFAFTYCNWIPAPSSLKRFASLERFLISSLIGFALTLLIVIKLSSRFCKSIHGFFRFLGTSDLVFCIPLHGSQRIVPSRLQEQFARNFLQVSLQLWFDSHGIFFKSLRNSASAQIDIPVLSKVTYCTRLPASSSFQRIA